MNKKNVWIVFVISAAALLAADLLLKYWAVENLLSDCGRFVESRDLLGPLLGLTFTRNYGAFFGFLSDWDGAQIFLSVLKAAILGGLLWYYTCIPHEKRMWFVRVPIILIFAGGVGNLYDRIRLGYVRDMLDFTFWEGFAIFNLADVYVTVGVFSLIIVGLFVVKDLPLV